MRTLKSLLLLGAALSTQTAAQGLRQVPQRFAYIQPAGILLGMGTAGLEFAVGTHIGLEVSGVGVYSREDGVLVRGAGGGLGVRRYFGEGELAGVVIGARVDGVWLEADNSDADRRFIAVGPFESRDDGLYFGIGATLGYRWLSRAGLFLEPVVGYEFLAGPRPLVAGSQDLQNRIGFIGGLAIGFAW